MHEQYSCKEVEMTEGHSVHQTEAQGQLLTVRLALPTRETK